MLQFLLIGIAVIPIIRIALNHMMNRSSSSIDRCGIEEPPAKMISPSKTTTANGSKSKRVRKAAAKQRLKLQDAETNTTSASATTNEPSECAEKIAPSPPKPQPAPCLNRRNIGANWQQAMASVQMPANGLKIKKSESISRSRNEHPTPPKRPAVNKDGN